MVDIITAKQQIGGTNMAETLLNRRRDPLRRFRGKSPHCSADVLKWLGLVCVLMGTFSRGVLQLGMLHLQEYTSDALYSAVEAGSDFFGYATWAVLLSLLSVLALPIFAKLLYEGWRNTSNAKRYLLRLLACALISEIPYDLVNYGSWLDWTEQNPVWGLALSLVMLKILQECEKLNGVAKFLVKALVVFAACLWAMIIRSQLGVFLVLLVAIFYLLSTHKIAMTLVGIVLCLIQFPAPFGMIFVHWYDGKKGKAPRWWFYVLYPAQLLLFGVWGMLLA